MIQLQVSLMFEKSWWDETHSGWEQAALNQALLEKIAFYWRNVLFYPLGPLMAIFLSAQPPPPKKNICKQSQNLYKHYTVPNA